MGARQRLRLAPIGAPAVAAALLLCAAAPPLGFVLGIVQAPGLRAPGAAARRAEAVLEGGEYLDKGRQEFPEAMIAAAVVQGETETAKQLVEKGLPLEARGAKGRTALMFAAWKGDLEMTKFLAEKGAEVASVEHKDSDGMTALKLAAVFDRVDVAEMLVEKGAEKAEASVLAERIHKNPEMMGILS